MALLRGLGLSRPQRRQQNMRRTMPPHFGVISMLVMLVAYVSVAYWRAALRIAATVLIALAIYGAVLIIEALHHVAR
jgi:hypothetical protein